MMTQTHLLVATALFAKPNHYARNTAAIVGSLIPDAALYGLFAWHRAIGDTPDYIFGELYWSQNWQRLLAPGNSFLVYGLIALAGYILTRRSEGWMRIGALVLVFGLSALIHVSTDFPLHVEDAYAHFWPITDWKFVSPVSYWDSRYHGYWVAPIESLLALGCIFFLFRRFAAQWVRCLLGLALVSYLAVPLMFAMSLG